MEQVRELFQTPRSKNVCKVLQAKRGGIDYGIKDGEDKNHSRIER